MDTSKETKQIVHEMTSTWLCRGNLKRENESLLIVTQDNTIKVKLYKS